MRRTPWWLLLALSACNLSFDFGVRQGPPPDGPPPPPDAFPVAPSHTCGDGEHARDEVCYDPIMFHVAGVRDAQLGDIDTSVDQFPDLVYLSPDGVDILPGDGRGGFGAVVHGPRLQATQLLTSYESNDGIHYKLVLETLAGTTITIWKQDPSGAFVQFATTTEAASVQKIGLGCGSDELTAWGGFGFDDLTATSPPAIALTKHLPMKGVISVDDVCEPVLVTRAEDASTSVLLYPFDMPERVTGFDPASGGEVPDAEITQAISYPSIGIGTRSVLMAQADPPGVALYTGHDTRIRTGPGVVGPVRYLTYGDFDGEDSTNSNTIIAASSDPPTLSVIDFGSEDTLEVMDQFALPSAPKGLDAYFDANRDGIPDVVVTLDDGFVVEMSDAF